MTPSGAAVTAASRHFDIHGPLPPQGITTLEASAGTGKTHTIAALVTRLVAADVAKISDILVITFTKFAASELRDRVRARLVSAELGLRHLPEGGDGARPSDQLVALLMSEARELKNTRRLLATAVADFDQATITTTHGFCNLVIAALGSLGNVAPGPAILEDPRDLISEVIDDLVARHVMRRAVVPFPRSDALKIGELALNNPGAPLDPPADVGDESPPGLRRRLAESARRETARRLLDRNLLTYNDLLYRLKEALADPERGRAACDRLRRRYSVVLVDEFQDTDALQWEILQRAFAPQPGAAAATRLVLVGDPKQAIYSFRGADVYAYLQAARNAPAEHRWTLDENWRSDGNLLAAFDSFLAPLHLGHREIQYRYAHAAAGHAGTALERPPVSAPLRVRVFARDDTRLARTKKGLAQKPSALKRVAEDLAADIAELLCSGAVLLRGSTGRQLGPEGKEAPAQRPVSAQDIGVLVRTNRQASFVQRALKELQIPVIVAAAGSVFSTRAALDWARLLEALEQPSSRPLAVAAGLSAFFGKRAGDLANADEQSWEALHGRLYHCAEIVRQSGPATLFAHVCASERLPERLLHDAGGERAFTDLNHVAELLHAEATRSQLGLAALRAWLARRCSEASSDGADVDEVTRRLDSGSPAVQVLTVHRAKGLEFPIVYLPYAWDCTQPERSGRPVLFHDPEDCDMRKLDLGGSEDCAYRDHLRLSQAEARGEDLRLLYVALTRARHQVVLWWAPVMDCQHSALGRVLLRKNSSGDVETAGWPSPPKDSVVVAELEKLAEASRGLISVEKVSARQGLVPSPPGPRPSFGELGAAGFTRELDTRWGRASYSSLITAAHSPGADEAGESGAVTSEPEDAGDAGAADEPPVHSPNAPDETANARPSPWDRVAAGAEVGILVHRILEDVDFAAADLQAAVSSAVNARLGVPAGVTGDTQSLCAGLVSAISTPLGAALSGACLADIAWGDRLGEVRFEFPVAGGDTAFGSVSTAALARLFRKYLVQGQLAGYGEELAQPGLLGEIRGYLTGSIDLAFRQLGPSGDRYFVADYKTNWLAPKGAVLTTSHYSQAAMEAEMRHAHYPLQALFYLVALHRYLRWRLPSYNPERNLGGAVYMFLRGMAGPDVQDRPGTEPEGVFFWRPPIGLVTEVSDLFAGIGLSGEKRG